MSQRGNRKRLRFCAFPGNNWYGPGCSGPGGAPINKVDAACKAHDECYRSLNNRCECDCKVLHRLRRKSNPYTKEGRQAPLLYHYMKMQTLFTCGKISY